MIRASGRHALLIANHDYVDDEADLKNPASDVELIAFALRRVGFNVLVRRNLDRSMMRDALRELDRKTVRGDQVFFYYSGHGMALRADGKSSYQNYLLGTKFRAEDELEAVNSGDVLSVNEVVERLEGSAATIRIVVIDACRDQPFTRSWSRSTSDPRGFVSVGQVRMGQGTFVAFSARQGQRALGGVPGIDAGPYAFSLARHLQQPNDDIRLVFGDVGSEVRRLTQAAQFPDYRDALDGRFYFVRAAADERPLASTSLPAPRVVSVPDRGTSGVPMIEVPAGEFFMGCDAKVDGDCGDGEAPGRKVILKSFYIDTIEVRVGAYRKCVEAGGCSSDGLTAPRYNSRVSNLYAERCNWDKPGRQEHPMNCVSWEQARRYCRWARKRLPTEQEWEKAARGTDGRKYPWGNEGYGRTPVANIDDEEGAYVDGFIGTSPVGSFSPRGDSPYGAQDMVGNVSELISDQAGWARIARGGASGTPAAKADVLSRVARIGPSDQSNWIGFRCARSVPE